MDEDLASFVKASIRSTWALELLLLMQKQQEQEFAAEELVRALRGSATLVSNCLAQLQNAGLLVADEAGNWRYAPASVALEELVDKLGRAYAERPLAVIDAILGSPDDRLKSFADAFRFPKKGD